ncbi:MAG TPA: hypothetical protein DD638_05260 [Pasteurellaceae bacterium]|nr:hypothetical protein [Pasteurellaceae bacterium]
MFETKEIMEKMLLEDRKWPASFLTRKRNYIAITRPEDLTSYDYVASLQKGQIIDWKKWDLTCSDITWEAWNYLLPIMQREYFKNLPNDMEDYLMKFFWYLSEDKHLTDLFALFNNTDRVKFKEWLSFILFSGNDPFSFLIEDELLSILDYIEHI